MQYDTNKPAPRKLHKPVREADEMQRDALVPYTSDGCDEPSMGSGESSGSGTGTPRAHRWPHRSRFQAVGVPEDALPGPLDMTAPRPRAFRGAAALLPAGAPSSSSALMDARVESTIRLARSLRDRLVDALIDHEPLRGSLLP